MGPDFFLVAGVIMGALAIPSILNAYSEGRSPRTAALMILVAGCCIVFAVTSSPVGYTMQDVPDAFVRVFGQFLN
ncbi:MAG: hypothetical protein MRY67_10620 [Rhodovulum sp.]|jgi:hypothetical protein|nr:hypothetical protein [Rhodovulum sp.]MCI5086364.1 hypothetical protein [Rhodovulum sp.]|tara:strand:+ start:869 stop:1093 length:225 start_codon:yes stop_codon:yes gene_type:complete